MNLKGYILPKAQLKVVLFKRTQGSLIAPDAITANKLLDFARYEFDLSELM
jgi:hypothetical protein